MSLSQVVTIIGLLAGTALIISAIRAFWNQRDGTSGIVAALVGLIMIGMSQWATISVKGAGIEIELAAIAQAVDAVAEEAISAATAVEATKQQLLSLSTSLERSQTITRADAGAIRDSLRAVPTVDPRAVIDARRTLRQSVDLPLIRQ
jgi:hypothetical protein